ncbi:MULTISPECIES: sensor histidine kinase [unclassified Streptomyces]|uniref:sensor histidine kinase n=1 Tax=unclassified Streptomyces TaxID=2593676 RepID=UPI003654CAB4
MSRLAAAVMRGQDLTALVEQIRENFGLSAISLLERDPEASPVPRWYVVASAGERPPERPYEADVESPVDDNLTLAVRGSGLSAEDQRVLAACAAELGLAHARGRIAGRSGGADTFADAERTRASLLLAAGRDLRAPLHTAEEALVRLQRRRAGLLGSEEAQLLGAARAAVHRAAQLVTDLDDVSRLHAGALDLYLRPVDLNEVLGAALDDLGPGGHSIVLHLPEQLPDVIADAALLTRALTALGADALRHSPPDRPPLFTAEVRAGQLRIRVEDGMPDRGPELSTAASRVPGTRADSLALRLSRDLAEAMDGTLETTTEGPAFSVMLSLPSSAPGASATSGRAE